MPRPAVVQFGCAQLGVVEENEAKGHVDDFDKANVGGPRCFADKHLLRQPSISIQPHLHNFPARPATRRYESRGESQSAGLGARWDQWDGYRGDFWNRFFKEESMLILTRKLNEGIVIGDDIRIEVVRISANAVRIGVAAPRNTPVHRAELRLNLFTGEAHGEGTVDEQSGDIV